MYTKGEGKGREGETTESNGPVQVQGRGGAGAGAGQACLRCWAEGGAHLHATCHFAVTRFLTDIQTKTAPILPDIFTALPPVPSLSRSPVRLFMRNYSVDRTCKAGFPLGGDINRIRLVIIYLF
ncbi:hypothetical protein U1Q18_037312 [Sarracenia purpurea var. burkii]